MASIIINADFEVNESEKKFSKNCKSNRHFKI